MWKKEILPFITVLSVIGNIFATEKSNTPENLLVNGDFSKGIQEWTWNPRDKSTASLPLIIESGCNNEKNSIRLSSPGQLTQKIALKPSGRYKLSGWIKPEQLAADKSLADVYFNKAPGENIRIASYDKSSPEWQFFETEFNAPGDQIVITLILRLYGNGTVYYAGISLFKVE